MLTYHPALDLYHCAYRTLLLMAGMPGRLVEIERIRIWDFYFVFPRESNRISIPQDLSFLRKLHVEESSYDDIVDPQYIFARMKPFQLSAYRYLAALGLISSEELLNENIVRTDKSVPSEILSRMENLSDGQRHILYLISSPLNQLSLYGEKGLKYRTKLLDFKYDPR